MENAIKKHDLIKVNGALEGFIAVYNGNGLFTVTTHPFRLVQDWTTKDLLGRIAEFGDTVSIKGFEHADNSWTTIQ